MLRLASIPVLLGAWLIAGCGGTPTQTPAEIFESRFADRTFGPNGRYVRGSAHDVGADEVEYQTDNGKTWRISWTGSEEFSNLKPVQ